MKWKTSGVNLLEKVDSPVIFASNHQSHVDTHVILATLPTVLRNKTAVAAAFDHFADADGTSKKKRTIQFLVAAIWHAFSIERIKSPLSSIRTMQNLLARGWSIVIYPEGTRSRTGDIARFKPGLALVAKKSGRPVVPVCVQGGLQVLPEATYLPHSGTIHVSFGEPLHFSQDESTTEFMARVESVVRSMAKNT
ncbi:MAG: 1-acyl-sn-glycerol-3-phosphate acyltransferase [Phycisphaerales bacterium]|nr:1-acyl-sn-glycerol-3-phosphate acyltransferase [Planctomycetota bacterium]MBL6998025.1 1-acyl-sn-glycerol-3-phosphate acyltransferase [Phycisphaerales bacterium]